MYKAKALQRHSTPLNIPEPELHLLLYALTDMGIPSAPSAVRKPMHG